MGIGLAVVFSSSLAAQTPPNFSGRWIIAPDPAAAQGRGRGATPTMGSGWGTDITVTQDATTITIECAYFSRYDMQPAMKFVYLLNGSESRNTINMGRGPQEQVSKAAWDGSKLVITTVHTVDSSQMGNTRLSGQTITSQTTQVLSLESPAALAIETTRSAAGRGGAPADQTWTGQPSTTKTMYKKN